MNGGLNRAPYNTPIFPFQHGITAYGKVIQRGREDALNARSTGVACVVITGSNTMYTVSFSGPYLRTFVLLTISRFSSRFSYTLLPTTWWPHNVSSNRPGRRDNLGNFEWHYLPRYIIDVRRRWSFSSPASPKPWEDWIGQVPQRWEGHARARHVLRATLPIYLIYPI